MLNEVDIDFRIHRLPHAVVKQAENCRVREMVKNIENHPHRQSVQRDLQQSKAYKPFSTTSKKIVQNCSRRTRRRSAKNAYHTGEKALSIARAGIQ